MRTCLLACLCILTSLLVGASAEQPAYRVETLIAVLDIQCGEGVNKSLATPLTNVIIEELVKLKIYTVIDRANRDKILAEQGFQQSGCASDACVVEMGQLLGVGKIVVGTLDLIGQTYIVNLQIVNVQTGAVEAAASERCKCDLDGLIDTVINATKKLFGQAPAPTQPTTPQPQPRTAAPQTGEMVLVPAGEFIMGSDSGSGNERPAHKVYLYEYYIDKYEVTNEQYNQCVSGGKCSANKIFNGFTSPQQPVVGVDWNQASTFCSWAGKRLPTEAEWEKAARGTDGRTYPWGEGIDCGKANIKGCNRSIPKPVGSYPSGVSPYGAMDMAGNVWEWVADWYDKNYYMSSPNRNPTGPASGSSRVMRGGGKGDFAGSARSFARSYDAPRMRVDYIGFRCAR